MRFYVEHTHKGNVDLNVNITVKSESPIEKEPVRKEEENPPKSFHAIIATLYLGISSSLIADPLKNLISNSGVPGWYNFIMLFIALIFLIMGLGYSLNKPNFNKRVFDFMMILTGAMIILVVALILFSVISRTLT